MLKYAFRVSHKNPPFYLCERPNYDQITQFEGTQKSFCLRGNQHEITGQKAKSKLELKT